MPKFALQYEFTALDGTTNTSKIVRVPFELSAGGVWFCKQNTIPYKPITGTQRKNVIEAGNSIFKTGAIGAGTFKSKNRRKYERTSASEAQYNRGKKLILRTGKYAASKYAASQVYEPKTFSLRCPAWLNNGVVLDAVRSFFKAHIKFNGTPTTSKELFDVIGINGVWYTIRDIDLVASGDDATTKATSAALAQAETLQEPTVIPSSSPTATAP